MTTDCFASDDRRRNAGPSKADCKRLREIRECMDTAIYRPHELSNAQSVTHRRVRRISRKNA